MSIIGALQKGIVKTAAAVGEASVMAGKATVKAGAAVGAASVKAGVSSARALSGIISRKKATGQKASGGMKKRVSGRSAGASVASAVGTENIAVGTAGISEEIMERKSGIILQKTDGRQDASQHGSYIGGSGNAGNIGNVGTAGKVANAVGTAGDADNARNGGADKAAGSENSAAESGNAAGTSSAAPVNAANTAKSDGDAAQNNTQTAAAPGMLSPDDAQAQTAAPDTERPHSCYVNRELSWLKFNERVLEEAESPSVPLCERLQFMSIFQSNLDEFFMVRIGSLKDQAELDAMARDNKTGMTPSEQIDASLEAVKELYPRRDRVYAELQHELGKTGIRLVDFHTISEDEGLKLEAYFDSELLPLLSPIVVGKRHPFPFMRTGDIYAVAELEPKKGKGKKTSMGLVPCGTGVFKRLIRLTEREYILSEELILHFLPKVFNEYNIKTKSLMRITRSADIDADAIYEEDIDYREFMEELIKRRRRLEPVRVEFSRKLGKGVTELVRTALELTENACYRSTTPLELSFLNEFRDVLRQKQEYFYPKRIPQRSAAFTTGAPLLPQIAEKDKLLSYPFDSMTQFLHMLKEAAEDESVLSIKMTLYRVAKQSEVVNTLIEAAENGKDVLVLVELKARFDEANNIEWSRRLENAGCTVIYGLPGYKVHSKLCLITYMKDGEPRYITQIGTGNYNEKTARLYTDLCLMTGNQKIGLNTAAVFRALAKGETVDESSELLVAPHCLQNRVISMIEQEIDCAKDGKPAYIGIKINSLTDKAIMDKLIEASQAGVKIDMIVRGICCLLPGVPERTENIRIISIVGRFLEHSRIYIFGADERERIYISSADFMTRNTLRRVEVAAPVLDADIRRQIRYMFDTMLKDNTQARELDYDGIYRRVKNAEAPLNSQEHFFELAYEQAGVELPG